MEELGSELAWNWGFPVVEVSSALELGTWTSMGEELGTRSTGGVDWAGVDWWNSTWWSRLGRSTSGSTPSGSPEVSPTEMETH
jgi:hypothetical protein